MSDKSPNSICEVCGKPYVEYVVVGGRPGYRCCEHWRLPIPAPDAEQRNVSAEERANRCCDASGIAGDLSHMPAVTVMRLREEIVSAIRLAETQAWNAALEAARNRVGAVWADSKAHRAWLDRSTTEIRDLRKGAQDDA